ncbi:MAG: hypothetical protein WBK20_02045 [Spirochaetota bacterium]
MRLYRHIQEDERIVIQKMMYSSKKVASSSLKCRRKYIKKYNFNEDIL